ESYGNLNMGAGFALYVAAADAERTVQVARAHGVDAWIAGRVEAGAKQVVIEPLSLTFAGEELHVRV
ncbi:MAG: phosphoribosylformylglycinamidine cyclo-ligase, partial [Burkholderiaceae bacterium]|nr:phosphoribosylformylglycinamidine cyclo-ligase [Burkholderiaceae bacterium]